MLSVKQKDHPIGVFDSGLGGLTVVKALMRRLPHEDIVYFGDTARVPYGTKSREAIIRFSKENVALLRKRGVKMIVVACNSSSSHALAALHETFDLPIIGVIEPGCRAAAKATKNKKVGIIATPATINSYAYPQEIARLDSTIKVLGQACPLFVPLIEEGWSTKPVTVSVAKEYLKKLSHSQIDTLILGCTHYPLLKPTLRKVLGAKVKLVDSAEEVVHDVRETLEKKNALNSASHKAQYKFLVSDEPAHFQKLARRFLGFDIQDVARVTT
ncbi:MAG: glutamate racemase [Candidatus Omnitrophica bacterium]|nr:glutamate racemase [Candidatus Omnitrophota bacterium]